MITHSVFYLLCSSRVLCALFQGILCGYDEAEDCLVVKEDQGITQCPWCQGYVDACLIFSGNVSFSGRVFMLDI